MIKTVIIDDDIEMLLGLTNIINWEDYGFTLVGQANNGLDGLHLVSEVMPDLIITDITMPSINGLELIKAAKKIKPKVKSIIISCHEDFNFAKEAIRLEADEYIIKHTLTKNELVQVLTNLKSKLESELDDRINLEKATHRINSNKYVILEKFFLDITENEHLDSEEAFSRAELMNISLPTGSFRIISFFIDDIEEVLAQQSIKEYNLFKFCILNIIEETVNKNENLNFFSYQKNAVALLYWDNGDAPINNRSISIVKEIQANILLFLKFKISACFSGAYPQISCFKKALEETQSLRDGYFYAEAGLIITARTPFKPFDGDSLKNTVSEIKGAFSKQDCASVEMLVKLLFDTLKLQHYEPIDVKNFLRRFLLDIDAMFGKYRLSMDNYMTDADTLIKYKHIFDEAVSYVFKRLDEDRNVSSRPEINKVIRYIETHISQDISCEGMANYVNMNSNYFSRLFKSEIGVSFSDYIMNKRMNVATELLNNSDYSTEEIAKAIGIESVSYFYRAYKKITGFTPGDVRNKMEN